jgi:hypothetical protein
MLVASTSVSGFNCTTPAASPWRMPPSQPSASAHSRPSACGPRGARRPASTSTTFPPARRLPWMRPTTTPSVSTSKSSSFHSPEEREVAARIRISTDVDAEAGDVNRPPSSRHAAASRA